MSKLIRKQIIDSVSFNTIKESRFKTMRISVTAFLPLEKATAAQNALMSLVMTRSCRKYPDFTVLSKKLSSLYGAALTSGFRKMGDVQALTFSVSGLDDRYALDGDIISKELSDLLCDVLFDPLLKENAFDSTECEQERRQLIDMIDSEFNEKRVYANQKALSIMCADEAYGIPRYGDRESVMSATPSDLFDAWQNMLKTARFEIIYVGDSDSSIAFDVFKKRFEAIDRKPVSLSTTVKRSADMIKRENEDMELSQSKMILGFRTDVAEPDSDVMATRLMCALLGGTAHSKLFCNVREKLSLCYYCSSSYIHSKGIMLVESGVERENIEKAEKAILGEIKAMQNGDISDEELIATKMSMSNAFYSSCDTVGGINAYYMSQMLDSVVYTPQEAVDKVNSITKEDVIACAKKLTLDTVFTLTGVSKNEEEV
ncbi:MAG: insulinase family protein [Ruminococcaceae bacterium]|nr:insulinase family protein [Oscillospiraceae bacterium]